VTDARPSFDDIDISRCTRNGICVDCGTLGSVPLVGGAKARCKLCRAGYERERREAAAWAAYVPPPPAAPPMLRPPPEPDAWCSPGLRAWVMVPTESPFAKNWNGYYGKPRLVTLRQREVRPTWGALFYWWLMTPEDDGLRRELEEYAISHDCTEAVFGIPGRLRDAPDTGDVSVPECYLHPFDKKPPHPTPVSLTFYDRGFG
jgi:hypothetical protein